MVRLRDIGAESRILLALVVIKYTLQDLTRLLLVDPLSEPLRRAILALLSSLISILCMAHTLGCGQTVGSP